MSLKLITDTAIVAGIVYAIAMLIFSLDQLLTTGVIDGGALIATCGVISGVVIAALNSRN